MHRIENLIDGLNRFDFRMIAKCLTIVENELPSYEELLLQLKPKESCHIIGITGPPGAGKSTLVNALLAEFIKLNKRIAVLSVDPSSPFNYGALLGDRIRMSEFYLHKDVFIRSVASRGSLGGLNAHIIEMIDVLKSSLFDIVLVETVGVGQSEVEIAGIADTTVVVMVPEAGDEVQTMKAGIMEIADIFVVNKADREQADIFIKNLKYLAHSKASDREIPVVKCIATEQKGIIELIQDIQAHQSYLLKDQDRRIFMLTEKAYQLIQQKRMKDVKKDKLKMIIEYAVKNEIFNLYKLVKEYENE